MPIYEYKCEKCGEEHEVMQKMTEKPLTVCQSCGGRLKKMISNTSFVLKGSGWYVTDYADKNRKNSAKEGAEKTEKKEKVDNSVQKERKKEKTETSAGTEAKKESKSEPKSSQKSKE